MRIKLFLICICAAAVALGFIFLSSGSDELNPDEFKDKIETQPGIVIDVRTPGEHDEGHLALTNRHLDFHSGEFENVMWGLDRNETYYLYCRTGNRSGQALEQMKDAGFKNVYNIGGFEELVSSGLKWKKTP